MTSSELVLVDLETYEPADAEIVSWYELLTASDHLLWEYDVSWAREPTTMQREIETFRARRNRHRGVNYPIWAMTNGQVVGMIGLNRHQEAARQHCGELGCGVAAAFARRGLGGRLLRAALQKARQLGLQRLEADCFADNVASITLLRKDGFQAEGLRVGAIGKDGQLRDQCLFGLLL